LTGPDGEDGSGRFFCGSALFFLSRRKYRKIVAVRFCPAIFSLTARAVARFAVRNGTRRAFRAYNGGKVTRTGGAAGSRSVKFDSVNEPDAPKIDSNLQFVERTLSWVA
jgi:hypothetical protein